MSAGICIMNRNAIAMAADSAVTVGDHAAIHNSANKLFSLSRIAPVSLIIYANAALMTVPVEIIVKQYKKQLGDQSFPFLRDYVDSFLAYLVNNSALFRFDINEETYAVQLFYSLLIGTNNDRQKLINEKKAAVGRELTDSEMEEVRDADCVIVAVAHNEFKEMSLEDIKKLYKNVPDEEKVLIDVKGLYKIEDLQASGIQWWRL